MPVNEAEAPQVNTNRSSSGNAVSMHDALPDFVCGVLLIVSISMWFAAIRAPLWLDETISVWQINKGFWNILSRQGGLSFPLYSYILWLSTKILGTGEIALRIPSILAMLGAVYLLYRTAREFFDRDVAIITAIIFSIHPLVIFLSIDVRPYAFAALAINAALFTLARSRQNQSPWLAAIFGILAACIVYFHFLYAVILPVLAVCFVLFNAGPGKKLIRQSAIALGAFTLAFLPVIPGILYMFRTSGTHVFDLRPTIKDLGWTLAPDLLILSVVGALLVAAATRKFDIDTRIDGSTLLLCLSTGLVPLLILFVVSVNTPLHIFVQRYRLVAVPGIALAWGLLISRVNSRWLRALFCLALVVPTAYSYLKSPDSHKHGYTWKYALELAEKTASADNATVLICSDLPESNYMSMPTGEAVKDSNLFSPLTYYKLSVPVIGLPRALNEEAMNIGADFLKGAEHKHFVFVAFDASFATANWLVDKVPLTHRVQILGYPDEVGVVDFVPYSESPSTPPAQQ